MVPQRIVCLTAEMAELAFALGCGDRVVGVTGYAVRPAQVRRLPRVAAFRTGSVDKICALEPDLVLGFSDMQADIAADLIRRGINVLITNQRTLAETYAAMLLVSRALGAEVRGAELVAGMMAEFSAIRATERRRRPVIFFEEWDEPLISGIAWIGELIAIAGGEDAFPGVRGQDATSRIIEPSRVVERRPDIIVASWCGKKANLERIRRRPGWDAIPAVAEGHLHEIKAPDILQPGISLVHGARQLSVIVDTWASTHG